MRSSTRRPFGLRAGGTINGSGVSSTPRDSLLARLVGYFLLLSLATILVVATVAFEHARRALEVAAAERLMAAANVKEDQLVLWVEEQRATVEFLAGLTEIIEPAVDVVDSPAESPHYLQARERLRGFLGSVVASQSGLGELLVLSAVGGKVLASTDPTHEGIYHVNESFFIHGKENTFVQNIYPSPVAALPMLTVATPMRDETERTYALVVGHLNLESIDRIVARSGGLGMTGESYLVDRFNEFVSAERFGRDRFPRGVSTDGIDAAVSGLTGVSSYINYAGVPVIGAYRWVESRELALLVEMHQAEALAPARRLLWTVLIVGLTSALALSCAVYVVALRIVRPIRSIAVAATEVAGGNFTAVATSPTRDEIGMLASAFNRMTDSLRKRSVELQKTNRDLEAANEELDAFTFSIAHDLRTPLRHIEGFSRILEEDYGSHLEPTAVGHLKRLREGARQMDQLTNDLLDFSRLGKQPLSLRTTELSSVVELALADVRSLQDEQKVEYRVSDLPSAVCDPALIRQVFVNLLSNAAKYSRSRELAVIEVDAKSKDGRVIVSVRDNGVGFNMKYADKLFRVFQRLHSTEQYEGTGVGLATVQRILHQHGERVWAESEPDKGATFYFSLRSATGPMPASRTTEESIV